MRDNPLETNAIYPYSNYSFDYGLVPSCEANASLGVVKT